MSWNKKKYTGPQRINCLDPVQLDNLCTAIPCKWSPYEKAILHIDERYLFVEPIKQASKLPHGRKGTIVFMVFEFTLHDKIYRRGRYLAGAHPDKKKTEWQTAALVTAGVAEGIVDAANVAARLRGEL